MNKGKYFHSLEICELLKLGAELAEDLERVNSQLCAGIFDSEYLARVAYCCEKYARTIDKSGVYLDAEILTHIKAYNEAKGDEAQIILKRLENGLSVLGNKLQSDNKEGGQ